MKTWGQIRSQVEFQVRHLKVGRNYSCPSFCHAKVIAWSMPWAAQVRWYTHRLPLRRTEV
jgi:hypothetical protein